MDDLFFATTEVGIIQPGNMSLEIPAICLVSGEVGNGYAPGRISTLVDPVNYVGSVVNKTETSGGADEESDDALAQRIYLAPSGYSTAGPEDAYRYWIQTYSPAVEDCYITSESPGEVDVYVMLQEGQIDAVKEKIEAACKTYQEWQMSEIGRDLNPSQLIYLLVNAGACHVVVRSPVWTEIKNASISKASSIKLEYGGVKDEKII